MTRKQEKVWPRGIRSTKYNKMNYLVGALLLKTFWDMVASRTTLSKFESDRRCIALVYFKCWAQNAIMNAQAHVHTCYYIHRRHRRLQAHHASPPAPERCRCYIPAYTAATQPRVEQASDTSICSSERILIIKRIDTGFPIQSVVAGARCEESI
jgi:hypothetical protein